MLFAQTDSAWDLMLGFDAIRDLRRSVTGGDWSSWTFALGSFAVQAILLAPIIYLMLVRARLHRSVRTLAVLALGAGFAQLIGLALLSLPWLGIHWSYRADWDFAIKWNVLFFFETGWACVAAVLGMIGSWLSMKHLGSSVNRLAGHAHEASTHGRPVTIEDNSPPGELQN